MKTFQERGEKVGLGEPGALIGCLIRKGGIKGIEDLWLGNL